MSYFLFGGYHEKYEPVIMQKLWSINLTLKNTLMKSELALRHHPNSFKKAIKVYKTLLISSLKFSAI